MKNLTANWEAWYRAGATGWDRGSAAPPLLEFLETNRMEGSILVPGCGMGHDVRALAGAGLEVVGLDIAPSAIRAARSFPPTDSGKYIQGDFFDLPKEFVGKFEWVFEHTCFCAIDPSMREAYVASAAAALRSGGHLLAIFYINPPWWKGRPPWKVSLNDLHRLFDGLFIWERDWLPTVNHAGREGRERMALLRKRDV